MTKLDTSGKQARITYLGIGSNLGNKKDKVTAGTNQKSGNTATYGSTNPMGTDLTNLGGGLFGCWIAAEIYGGWYEPKTILARKFVNSDEFPKWLYNLYMKIDICSYDIMLIILGES